MARFEDLFPNADSRLKEPFTPIRPTALPGFGASMGVRVRRAIDTGQDPAQDQSNIDDIINSVRGLAYKSPKSGLTTFGDYARAAGSGAASLGASLIGAAEYGTRTLAGEGETPFQQGMTDLTQSLTDARKGVDAAAQRFVSRMSPEAQARLAREWTTLDPSKTIWQGGVGEFVSSLFLQAAQALPSSLVTLIPAGIALRAGMHSGALTYLGASEAVMSTGSIATNIATEIEQAPEQELMESKRYQELRGQFGDAEARQQLIREAQGYAPVIGGAIVGLIGRQVGRYLKPVFTKAGGRGALSRFGVGFATEAPQEASQSATEQIAQNLAAQIYDQGRVWDERTLEAAVQGGALGGLIGGGVTAALGRGPQPPTPLGEPPTDAGVVKADDVPEDIRAALKASEEAARAEVEIQPQIRFDPYTGQGEMFPSAGQESVPGELAPTELGMTPEAFARERAAYEQRPWPLQQMELDLGPPARDQFPILRPGEQMPLGLRARRRGGGSEIAVAVPPEPVAPEQPIPGTDLPVQKPLERLPETRVPTRGKTRADRLRLRALEQRQNELAAQQEERAARTAGMMRDEAQLDLFAPEPGVSEAATSILTGTKSKRELLGFATRVYNPDGRVISEVLNADAESANAAADQMAARYPEAVIRVERVYGQLEGEPSVTTTIRQVFAGDEPIAEPVSDVVAQLQDLKDPNSPRKGVYLSRLNIEGLRRAGAFERTRGVGVPLPDFDGKGGTLIAKDRATAVELLRMRDEGAANMQEILGYATGAGTGKPVGGSIVVQQRTPDGAVTRESLVATQEEADALAADWETEGRETVILSLPAAMRRRAQRTVADIDKANEVREWRSTMRETEDLIAQELNKDIEEAETVRRLVNRPKIGASRSRAARAILTYAKAKERNNRKQRLDGFDLPRNRKFATPELNERYRELWNEYADLTTRAEVATTAEGKRAAQAEASAIRDLLITFIRNNPSSTAVERIVRVAQKLDPTIQTKTRNSESAPNSETLESVTDEMPEMSRVQVRELSGEALDLAFMRAANYLSGLRKKMVEDDPSDKDKIPGYRTYTVVGRSYNELVQKYSTPSERKKLILRAQRIKRARKWTTIRKGGLTSAATESERAYQRRKDSLPFESAVMDSEGQNLAESSDEVRAEFVKKLDTARQELTSTLSRTTALHASLYDGEYAQIASELTKNGRSDDARDAIYGRAYLQSLNQFAQMLLNANAKTLTALRELRKVTKLLQSLEHKQPRKLARQLGAMMRAESREQVLTVFAKNRIVLKGLNIPEKRAEMTAKTNRAVVAAARLERRWKRNLFFTRTIAPYMRKLVEFVMSDGQMGVRRGAVVVGRPTQRETAEVALALQKLRTAPETRTELYVPLRKWFEEMGFAFKDGEMLIPSPWKIPDDILLQRRYNRRFGERNDPTLINAEAISTYSSPDGTELEPFTSIDTRTPAQQLRDYQRGIEERRNSSTVEITAAGFDKLRIMEARNQAVRQLRATINSKNVTAAEVIAAEERYFEFLKTMGVADKYADRLNRWKVTLPDGTTTVRMVGPRLAAGKMDVSEAREIMLNLYKEREFSPEMVRYTRLHKEASKTFEEFERKRKFRYSAAERRRVRAITEERVEERKNRQNDGLFFLKETATPQQFVEAGRNFNELMDLNSGVVSMNDALIALWRNLPSNSRFAEIAQRILDLNMDVEVVWANSLSNGATELFPKAVFRFGSGLQTIKVNREWFNRIRTSSDNAHAALTHALLHEAVHAATIGKLAQDRNLRYTLEMLRGMAAREIARRGLGKPYGVTNVYEFVAEAFSNPKFQETLASIRVEPQQSLWQKFLKLLRDMLGLPSEPRVENALDAVLLTTDQLFAGIDIRNMQASEMYLDGPTQSKLNDVIGRLKQGREVRDMLKSRTAEVKENTSSGILAVMTMEQIRDFFGKHFQISTNASRAVDRNPLNEYWRAFTERNAMNSELMERADSLSREWTKLAEQKPEEAVELSRLMTEATIDGIHPDLPLTDELNNHLKHPEKKVKHAELAARFAKLTDGAKLYKSLRNYYADSLKREVTLQTLNALRAVLTSGKDGISREVFDKTYNEASVEARKLNTKKGLRAEFSEDILSDSELNTIVRIASIPAKWKGPYFPLSRFGDYSVYAERVTERKLFHDKTQAAEYRDTLRANDSTIDASVKEVDGAFIVEVKEIEYRLAETRTEADEARREMVARYGEKAVTPIQLRTQSYLRDAAISNDQGLSSILQKLEGNDAAKAAVKNFYLRTLADSSFRKHEVNRKNRRGVNYELQHRAFANYAKSASYYTAQLKHGWRMAEAKAKMREVVRDHRDESTITSIRMGQILREITKRDEMTTDPVELSKLTRRGTMLSHFMLLTSPSYWIINATQPYTVLLPWLGARGGYMQAAAALAQAQKLIASPLISESVSSWAGLKALKSKVAAEKAFTVLEQVEKHIKERGGPRADDYLDMLKQLKRQSIIDLSFIAELREMAEGEQATLTSRVLDASRIMSHLTEVNNRIISALASYDVARAQKLNHEQSVEFAKRAVSMTQFNYSAGNKPRLFQEKGPLGVGGPLMFQFMQYPQHMYALIIGEFMKAVKGGTLEHKTAIKTLAGVFATHLVAAGVLGATLQPLKWAIGAMMAMFDDDDDRVQDVLSGDKFNQVFREVVADLFGTDAGLLISKGLPAALGADVSDRMSLGTLYFIDLKPENAESLLGSMVMAFGGPLPGIVTSWFKGFQEIEKGELTRAGEFFVPKAVKDLLQAKRFAAEGVTSATGAVIVADKNIEPKELFLKSLGFQPTLVSEAYSAQSAIKRREQTDDAVRTRLTNMFLRANTPEERKAVRQAIMEYNRNTIIPITYSSLMRSRARSQERDRNIARYGADLRGVYQRYAKEAEPYAIE